MQDAAQILKIMTEINAIPLALQITSIAGWILLLHSRSYHINKNLF
jgi:hypothetical protein